MNEELPDIDTGLIDLTTVDMTMIGLLGDSALASSLRRVIESIEDEDDAVANFQDGL
jgi:FXSXX-COOH protein